MQRSKFVGPTFLDDAILAIASQPGEVGFGANDLDRWSAHVVERATALSLARERKLMEFAAQDSGSHSTGVPERELHGIEAVLAGAPVSTSARSAGVSPGGDAPRSGRAVSSKAETVTTERPSVAPGSQSGAVSAPIIGGSPFEDLDDEKADTGSTDGRAGGGAVNPASPGASDQSRAGITPGPVSAPPLVDVEALADEMRHAIYRECRHAIDGAKLSSIGCAMCNEELIRKHTRPIDREAMAVAIHRGDCDSTHSAREAFGVPWRNARQPLYRDMADAAIEELARQMNTGTVADARLTRLEDGATKASPASATPPAAEQLTEEQREAVWRIQDVVAEWIEKDSEIVSMDVAHEFSKVVHLFVKPQPAVTEAMRKAIVKHIGHHHDCAHCDIREELAKLDAKTHVLVESGELKRLRALECDESTGDVIASAADGSVTLDDGTTTYNPRRAIDFVSKQLDAAVRLKEEVLTAACKDVCRLEVQRNDALRERDAFQAKLDAAGKVGP